MIVHTHWTWEARDSQGRRLSLHTVHAACDWCGAPATEPDFVTLGSGDWEAKMQRSKAARAGFVERLDHRVTRLFCPLCACVFDQTLREEPS